MPAVRTRHYEIIIPIAGAGDNTINAVPTSATALAPTPAYAATNPSISRNVTITLTP